MIAFNLNRMVKTSEKEAFFNALGAHIKKIREEKGLSLRDMELEGDLDRHALSKIENGKLHFSAYSLKKIADVLEISLEELFKGFK